MNTIHTPSESLEESFSERINNVPRSFLREILKLTSQKDVISFAGGLPSRSCFPKEEIIAATIEVLSEDTESSLQYAETEGYLPLRRWICNYYQDKYNLSIAPEEVLITNGSQQGLDLIGKTLINQGDSILLENPSYLGAIQAFSMYQPEFFTVNMEEDGPDIEELNKLIDIHKIKLMYCVPDFQNPTGRRWSVDKRKTITDKLKKNGCIIVEDNPYSEINFSEKTFPALKKFSGRRGIMLGSFSKTIAPGFRIGWIVADKPIIEKLVIAKQASDLHSNVPGQKIIYKFLNDKNWEGHLAKLRKVYSRQKEIMINALKKYFPAEVKFENPAGGMFIWVTLPTYMNSYEILEKSIQQGVAFVPGNTFFINEDGANTMRLNYSNSSEEEIEKGIQLLGNIIHENQFAR